MLVSGIRELPATSIRCFKHSSLFPRSSLFLKWLPRRLRSFSELLRFEQIRDCVYNYQHNEAAGDADQSQPVQLQRLFAALQLSERASADTRPLTRSVPLITLTSNPRTIRTNSDGSTVPMRLSVLGQEVAFRSTFQYMNGGRWLRSRPSCSGPETRRGHPMMTHDGSPGASSRPARAASGPDRPSNPSRLPAVAIGQELRVGRRRGPPAAGRPGPCAAPALHTAT